MAEADWKITHEMRQFIAGHKGDMEAIYAFGCELPPNIIKRIKSFKSCEPYLDSADRMTWRRRNRKHT